MTESKGLLISFSGLSTTSQSLPRRMELARASSCDISTDMHWSTNISLNLSGGDESESTNVRKCCCGHFAKPFLPTPQWQFSRNVQVSQCENTSGPRINSRSRPKIVVVFKWLILQDHYTKLRCESCRRLWIDLRVWTHVSLKTQNTWIVLSTRSALLSYAALFLECI